MAKNKGKKIRARREEKKKRGFSLAVVKVPVLGGRALRVHRLPKKKAR